MKLSNVCIIILAFVLAGNLYVTHRLLIKIEFNLKDEYPVGTTEIRILGRGWSTFHLKIGGKERIFLRHVFLTTGTEAITELFDAVEETK